MTASRMLRQEGVGSMGGRGGGGTGRALAAVVEYAGVVDDGGGGVARGPGGAVAVPGRNVTKVHWEAGHVHEEHGVPVAEARADGGVEAEEGGAAVAAGVAGGER
jgi:hypothetical protein